jgi:hypothetical protein
METGGDRGDVRLTTAMEISMPPSGAIQPDRRALSQPCQTGSRTLPLRESTMNAAIVEISMISGTKHEKASHGEHGRLFGDIRGQIHSHAFLQRGHHPLSSKAKLRCKISTSSLRKLPKTALSGGVSGNYRHILSGVAANIFPEAIRLPV